MPNALDSKRKRLRLGKYDTFAKLARERLAEEGHEPPSAYHPLLVFNASCTGTEAWDLTRFEQRVECWYRRIRHLPCDHHTEMWIHQETMRISRCRNSSEGNAPTRILPLLARLVHVKAKYVTSVLDSAYENGLSIDTGRRLTAQVFT